MSTYTVNVAEQDSQGNYRHLFRVTNLVTLDLARRVAAICQNTAGTFLIEITEWTVPTGKVVR